MIRLSPTPEVSYRKRLLVSGSCDSTQMPALEVWHDGGEIYLDAAGVQVSRTGQTSWVAWLELPPGRWRILAGEASDTGVLASDTALVEVKASAPVLENLRTPLDEHGAVLALPRDEGESLRDYQQLLLDAWRRPGGRSLTGTVANLERVLRLRGRLGLVVMTSQPGTIIKVSPDQIRWTCSSYVRTDTVLYDASHHGVRATSPISRVLRLQTHGGQEIKGWNAQGDLVILEDDCREEQLELVYQYWRVVELDNPAESMPHLLLRLNSRCVNSDYYSTGRKGTCRKGHGRTGWPARFLDSEDGASYLPCANGSCPDWSAADPVRWALGSDWRRSGYETDDSLLQLPVLQIVGDGAPLSLEQADERLWMAAIPLSPAGVKPLLSPIVRRALTGDRFFGGPLHQIQQEMEGSFQNLWDSGALGKAVISRADRASYDSLSPSALPPDQVDPELFVSGVGAAPSRLRLVDLPGNRWEARVAPGYFWHGATQYYLYAQKRTTSLAGCAVLEVQQDKARWEKDGQPVSEEPGVIGFASWAAAEAGVLPEGLTNLLAATSPSGRSFISGRDAQGVTSIWRVSADGLELLGQGPVQLVAMGALDEGKLLLAYQSGATYDARLWSAGDSLSFTGAGLWGSGTSQIIKIHVDTPQSAAIAGTDGRVVFWTPTSVSVTSAASPLSSITCDLSGAWWAAGGSGWLMRWSGAAWVKHASTSIGFWGLSGAADSWRLSGDAAAILKSDGSWWLARRRDESYFQLHLPYASVLASGSFTLTMMGRSFTFKVAATADPADGAFLKGADQAAFMANLRAAIEASPFAGLVGVYYEGTELMLVPVGGPLVTEAMLAAPRSCDMSAMGAGTTAQLVADSAWLLEKRVRPAGAFRLVGDKRPLAYDPSEIFEGGDAGLWHRSGALGSVYDARGDYGVCISGTSVLVLAPSGPIYAGPAETMAMVQVSLGLGQEKIPVPRSLVQTLPGKIRILLGPLLAERPDLWRQLRWDDRLLFGVISKGESDATVQDMELPLRQVALRFRLPSLPKGDGPVVMTNNMIRREDAFRDRSAVFVQEEFYADEDGWITFSRRPSLLLNPSFETVDGVGRPEGWSFVGPKGEALEPTSQMRRVSVSELPGCSWRGEAAVMFQTGTGPLRGSALQAAALLDPAHPHTLSFTARKGLVQDGAALLDTRAQVPLRIQLIPLGEDGSELAWPAATSGGFGGWSDPLPLTNLWTRYAFSFGRGERRLPEGTDRLLVRLVSLGSSSGAHAALIDSVQLEEGALATDYVDRPYGLGDDLTIEYEEGEGEYTVPLEVNPAVLPESPTIGIAEVDAWLPLAPEGQSEQPDWSDLGELLAPDAVDATSAGGALTVTLLAEMAAADCWHSQGAEGYLVSAQLGFTAPVAGSWAAGIAFGPTAAPWRVLLEGNPDQRFWSVLLSGVRQIQPSTMAAFSRLRIEATGQRELRCYGWSGSAWVLDAVFTIQQGASLPRGPVGLAAFAPVGTAITLGTGLAFSYETAQRPADLVRIDDWNPYYDKGLLQSATALRYDKSLHRASVPYAAMSGTSKLRWRRDFTTHDTAAEVTVLPGEAADAPRILELAPTVDQRSVRRSGSLVRLSALVKSSTGEFCSDQPVWARLIQGSLGRLRQGAASGQDLLALTDQHGLALVEYLTPAALPYNVLRLTKADGSSYSPGELRSPMGEAPTADSLVLASEDGLDNACLALVVNADGTPYTGASLIETVGEAQQVRTFRPLTEVSGVTRVLTLATWTTFKSSVVRQNDRLSRFTLAATPLRGTVSLSLNGKAIDQEATLERCYATPGTCFVQYEAGLTWIYYHRADAGGGDPASFSLTWAPRFLFLTTDGQIKVQRSAIGLPQNCWLRIEPDLVETVEVSLAAERAGTAAASRQTVKIVSTVETPLPVGNGEQPVRNLSVIFDQQVGSTLYPLKPGSGDSLRVHFKWRPPLDLTSVAGYRFEWTACGPTGFYNEAPTAAVAMAGSEQAPYLFFDKSGSWVNQLGEDVPAQSGATAIDVIVKWPGNAHLDDTLDGGPVAWSRLTPEAGGDVVWEGGGIDRATYALRVLTVDALGNVLGVAEARAEAPDLTPPQPPAVYPGSSARIEVSLDCRHASLESSPWRITVNDPVWGALYRQLAATGLVRVSYLSGSVQALRSGDLHLSAGFKVGKVSKDGRIYDVQDLSFTAPAYSTTRELIELTATGQRSFVGFSETEAADPPPLALALPLAGSGQIKIELAHAQPWIEQLLTTSPAVAVRWQERNYLRRDLDTGLLSPSFDKEIHL